MGVHEIWTLLTDSTLSFGIRQISEAAPRDLEHARTGFRPPKSVLTALQAPVFQIRQLPRNLKNSAHLEYSRRWLRRSHPEIEGRS